MAITTKINSKANIKQSSDADLAGAVVPFSLNSKLLKYDKQSVVFTKTGAQTLEVKANTSILVNSQMVTFFVNTSVVMPTLTAGTDYAIYVCTDGTIRADSSFTAPTGYTVNNSTNIT